MSEVPQAVEEVKPTRYGDQFHGGCCTLVERGIPCAGYAEQAKRIAQLEAALRAIVATVTLVDGAGRE